MGRRFAANVIAMPHRFGFDRRTNRNASLNCILLASPSAPATSTISMGTRPTLPEVVSVSKDITAEPLLRSKAYILYKCIIAIIERQPLPSFPRHLNLQNFCAGRIRSDNNSLRNQPPELTDSLDPRGQLLHVIIKEMR
jgi:hypothetical protein